MLKCGWSQLAPSASLVVPSPQVCTAEEGLLAAPDHGHRDRKGARLYSIMHDALCWCTACTLGMLCCSCVGMADSSAHRVHEPCGAADHLFCQHLAPCCRCHGLASAPLNSIKQRYFLTIAARSCFCNHATAASQSCLVSAALLAAMPRQACVQQVSTSLDGVCCCCCCNWWHLVGAACSGQSQAVTSSF